MVAHARPSASHPRSSAWGLREAADAGARRVERGWRLPVLLALVATIPAFYAELIDTAPVRAATLAYLAAALMLAGGLLHAAARCAHPPAHLRRNPLDILLAAGLLTAALLPPSGASPGALTLRLAVSLLTLLRLLWSIQHLFGRGGLPHLMLLALAVLGLCGTGFWWLEPTVHGFGEGLWLAFTTAATVGYGDVVPTTPAAKIFAVFVVVFGFGVLTLVTAAIATRWIETEERRIEREILHDLRAQITSVRSELGALRAELRAASQLLSDTRRPKRARPSKGEPV